MKHLYAVLAALLCLLPTAARADEFRSSYG